MNYMRIDFKIIYNAWTPKDFSQTLLSASENNLVEWMRTHWTKANNVLALLSQQVGDVCQYKLASNSIDQ